MILEKIKGIFGLNSEEQNDEVLEAQEEIEANKVGVKVFTLNAYADVDNVLDMLRNGYVVFLRIRELREKSISELKRSVEKLKKTTLANSGDIIGVDEDFLVLTPKFASIFRGQTAPAR